MSLQHPDRSLLSPKELREELPISAQQKEFVQQTREQIRSILDGTDPRLLVIVGPCSIHDITAAKEYATKLRQLMNEVSETFLIIMRAYFEKPRTQRGWKGLLYDPFLDGSHAIATGLRWSRQFLLDLADLKIPAATEFLDPSTSYYLGDLISWACVGARTAESQIHRQMASGLPMPIAFKNSTLGSVEIAVNGVMSATEPHIFIGPNGDGHLEIKQTKGNPYAHIVLRGGENKPNYDPPSISKALTLLQKAQLPLHLIVDCSHDNSNRNHEKQIEVFQSLIHQIIQGNHYIRGMALESHLFAGNQSLENGSRLKYAVSVTDSCLDWASTVNLLQRGHEALENVCRPRQNSKELCMEEAPCIK